jgi:hypothetical protein
MQQPDTEARSPAEDEFTLRIPPEPRRRLLHDKGWGTEEGAKHWVNTSYAFDIIVSDLVWLLSVYSLFVVLWVALVPRAVHWVNAPILAVPIALGLWAQAKAALTDPGTTATIETSLVIASQSRTPAAGCAAVALLSTLLLTHTQARSAHGDIQPSQLMIMVLIA